MKHLSSITVLLLAIHVSYCQSDSTIFKKPEIPHKEYAQNIYDPETNTINFSYNYSNKWDFDGDGKNDSLFFIGNGGAHIYFYPNIVLSSDGVVRRFPFAQIDMPFLISREAFDKLGKNSPVQFFVDNLDKDGVEDIYLNLDDTSSSIPKKWRRKGITTKRVLLSFPGGKLKLRDY